MKKLCLLISFVSVCGSCRKDDSSIGPDNLLYQRWHLYQAKRIGDTAWFSYDTGGYYDTEYRPDGALIHRKNGVVVQASCCEPVLFNRNGTVIKYTGRDCPFTLCAATSHQSTITQLTNDLLELKDGTYISQYRAVR